MIVPIQKPIVVAIVELKKNNSTSDINIIKCISAAIDPDAKYLENNFRFNTLINNINRLFSQLRNQGMAYQRRT